MTNYLNNPQVNLVLQHSLLKKSCKCGNIEAFEILLKELDNKSIDYEKLVRIACQQNHMDIVELLLNSGSINHCLSDVFNICITMHYNDSVKKLLNSEIFIKQNSYDDFYQDSIRLAIMVDNVDVVDMFLQIDNFKITRDVLKCAKNRASKGYIHNGSWKLLINSDKLRGIVNDDKDVYNYLLNVFENNLGDADYYPEYLYDIFSKDSDTLTIIIYSISSLLVGGIIFSNLYK